MLQALGPDPQLELRLDALPHEGMLVVEAVLSSTVATTFQLYYELRASTGLCEAQSQTRAIVPGRNRVSLMLPCAVLSGYLRIDPASCEGEYRLSSLWVRSEYATAATPDEAGPE